MVTIKAMTELKDRREERKQYREEHQEEIKQYYQDNKLKYCEKAKEYREAHLDKIKAYDRNRSKLMVMCPNCNCSTNQHHLTRHLQTKKCKEAVQQII